MSPQRTYPHGVPCWVDTEQPDPAAACEFYGGLFGWTFEDAVPEEAPGSYLIASLTGRDVAAIAPPAVDQPVAWNTYIAVDSADAAAAAVRAAGGVVLEEPADVGPGGRYAICADPRGARFRLWQAGRRLGAQVANEAGAWNFSDLRTGDARPREQLLCAAVRLGGRRPRLRGDDPPPGYADHLEATVDPGIRERQKGVGAPPGFEDVIAWVAPAEDGPEHWHVTFAVADRDDAAARAESLGATVVASEDGDWTRTALVRDPQGAELTLSQFTPPGS